MLITGHTGFKGGWLSLWLNELGSNILGYALAPTLENEFYSKVYSTGFDGEEIIADVADYSKLFDCISTFKPEIIFHLAAQPLVRLSYKEPAKTFMTNTMGVINILEAVRNSNSEPIMVNVTTDKVYANKEWLWAYREIEEIGGNDPYAASKACSEIATNSYMQSFFKGTAIRLATARAGNVIGGGDMSRDRLIPDYFRAITNDDEIILRNPLATRPWQHVLEPLAGYMKLAEVLHSNKGAEYVGSWNFGPMGDPVAVSEVVNILSRITGGKTFRFDQEANSTEAQSLMLDSAKARGDLDWRPKLSLEEALKMTCVWFAKSQENIDMREFTRAQILEFQSHD